MSLLSRDVSWAIAVFVHIIVRFELASWLACTPLDGKYSKYRFAERHIDYVKLKIALSDNELRQVERAFNFFMSVFIRTVLNPDENFNWPALKSAYYVRQFVNRNLQYAQSCYDQNIQ